MSISKFLFSTLNHIKMGENDKRKFWKFSFASSNSITLFCRSILKMDAIYNGTMPGIVTLFWIEMNIKIGFFSRWIATITNTDSTKVHHSTRTLNGIFLCASIVFSNYQNQNTGEITIKSYVFNKALLRLLSSALWLFVDKNFHEIVFSKWIN